MFAQMNMNLTMNPGGILMWIVVGLIAGWLAGLFMRGSGYGILLDIVLGLVGAFVGGLIFSLFVPGEVGFWGSVGIAFIGACILIAISRVFAPRRTY
jgi:uncharacterized membrane protein YeaQ/YmgE (transglycosylase-associated protein family)